MLPLQDYQPPLSPDVPLASIETAGLVKQAENQTDSDASTLADLVTDFNALLAKLKMLE